MAHQYTFPEMQFLEGLGFTPEIARAGKFGLFYEQYIAGDAYLGKHVRIEMVPSLDSRCEVETPSGKEVTSLGALTGRLDLVGVWRAPETLPRSDRVDLHINGYAAGLPNEKYASYGSSSTVGFLSVDEAVQKVRVYVDRHRDVIAQLPRANPK